MNQDSFASIPMTSSCRIAWLLVALLRPVMLRKHVSRQRIYLDHAEIQFVTPIRDGRGMGSKE